MKCFRCNSWHGDRCDCADGQTIFHGDAMDILPLLSCESVITDPPYMIGSHSTGVEESKTGGWGDQMNAAHFYAGWLAMVKKCRTGSGFISVFGNWRSLAVYLRAFSLARIPATSCIVWDKDWIGPGYKNAFRPRWELVLVSGSPQAEVKDRSAPDVVVDKWMASQSGTTGHSAEKSIGIVSYLVKHTSEEGGRVLDPFMGSGTTLRACKVLSRSGIGIEIEERYCEIAANRLRQEVLQFTD